MKRNFIFLLIALFSNVSVFSQKKAIEYLNEAPIYPKIDVCSCNRVAFWDYAKALYVYTKQLREDINRRTAIATENDLQGNQEFESLLKQLSTLAAKEATRLYNLQAPASEKEKDVINEQLYGLLNTRAEVLKMGHRDDPEYDESVYKQYGVNPKNPKAVSKDEQKEKLVRWCHINYPKYKSALDSCVTELRYALPLYRRKGELEYAGSEEVKELAALNAVLVTLEQYRNYMFIVSYRNDLGYQTF
jgi:hypothetical protein